MGRGPSWGGGTQKVSAERGKRSRRELRMEKELREHGLRSIVFGGRAAHGCRSLGCMRSTSHFWQGLYLGRSVGPRAHASVVHSMRRRSFIWRKRGIAEATRP